jgi:hypothetical protein
MQKYNRVLFEQELNNHVEIRLEIINTAIAEYLKSKGLSTSSKTDMKQIHGIKYFFFEGDLIIGMRDGFVFNGISYQIKYSLNDLLSPLSI